jgi:hypothetical protein
MVNGVTPKGNSFINGKAQSLVFNSQYKVFELIGESGEMDI